jgi:hypothetical protein
MNSTTETPAKPSREELKQRLEMAKMRSNLSRMPKKQREEKVEKIKATMEEQQKTLMEQLKMLPPEQLKAMGVDPTAFAQQLSQKQEPKNDQEEILINNAVLNEPLNIPKMKPVSTETIVNNQKTLDI